MSLLPQPQVTEVILHLSKLMATLCTTSGSDGVAGSVTVPLRWNPAGTARGEEGQPPDLGACTGAKPGSGQHNSMDADRGDAQ